MKRNAAATTNEMLTAWAGPWGVSFALNLTPAKETGIGGIVHSDGAHRKTPGTTQRPGHSSADALVRYERSDG
jgi:hypothetical protein